MLKIIKNLPPKDKSLVYFYRSKGLNIIKTEQGMAFDDEELQKLTNKKYKQATDEDLKRLISFSTLYTMFKKGTTQQKLTKYKIKNQKGLFIDVLEVFKNEITRISKITQIDRSIVENAILKLIADNNKIIINK